MQAPGGDDVYAGFVHDYSGRAVNAEAFLAVLSGNASSPAITRTWHSSGRVVEAGPADRLFLYYSDHGAPGLLGMPSGDFLYADQLHAALKRRARRGGFREAVVYVEVSSAASLSCQSKQKTANQPTNHSPTK